MRRLVVAAFTLILSCGGGIRAETFPDIDTMTTICVATSHARLCEVTREAFKGDWRAAKRGDYPAQRNVAFCLSTGCDGAVVVDRVEGCAWRMIIQGSKGSKEQTERASYEDACALPADERRQALERAEGMYRQIYGSLLPLEKLMRN